MVANNRTKFQQNPFNGFWGVASTKCSYVVVCIKSIKSHNSCKICRIKMAEWYEQLHMMANNHTKFQQNPFCGFRGVASTKCSYVVVFIKSIKSHNSCKICRIKMAAGYDQLHMVANNHTKFQQNPFSGFRGVASTKCSYVVVCIKSIKSHNSCKICRIKMAVWYDQLHMVANNHTKFQQNPFSGFQGVASTKCSYVVVCIKLIKSHNSCKICRIKMAVWYDQLHMVANNHTKFQQNPFSGFQGVASTKTWHGRTTRWPLLSPSYKVD